MDVIKGFIGKYAVVGLLIVLGVFAVYHLAVVGGYKATISLKNTEIANLQSEVGKLTVENVALTQANKEFEEFTTVQNSAIEGLISVSKQTQDVVAKELKKARETAAKYQEAYALVWESPGTSEDQCLALDVRINQYLKLRKEEATQ